MKILIVTGSSGDLVPVIMTVLFEVEDGKKVHHGEYNVNRIPISSVYTIEENPVTVPDAVICHHGVGLSNLKKVLPVIRKHWPNIRVFEYLSQGPAESALGLESQNVLVKGAFQWVDVLRAH